MDKSKKISFSIDDQLLGQSISPDNISLPLLKEFLEQVSTFLRGSESVNLKEIKTSIKTGSLALEVENSTGTLNEALSDYEKAKRTKSLQNIDPVRARILMQWQDLAKRNDGRVYKMFTDDEIESSVNSFLLINEKSDFEAQRDVWFNIETYVYGRIFDLGGKSKSNVHIELENGRTLTVESDPKLLTVDKTNRLYKRQLLQISAKQHLVTRELKDERLISFEDYSSEYDEEGFNAIAKVASKAWKSIESPTQWVESLRGNGA